MILQPGLAPVMEGGTDIHRDLHELLCKGGGGGVILQPGLAPVMEGGTDRQRLTRVAV